MEVPVSGQVIATGDGKTSGTVPAKAKTAIMGIRINCECLCDGTSDLLVGKFNYQESVSGTSLPGR